jgi:GNAT superfamily N-acetyltransferase
MLATIEEAETERVVGIGQFYIEEALHTAEVGLVVRDDYQNRGIGSELLAYLTHLAQERGLFGFTARVLMENRAMLHLFEHTGLPTDKHITAGTVELRIAFGRGGGA